ncbi:hypothetical protein PMZ80_000651 [Knufia obscura]|uniref:Uncharacterized protein n=1 Tax=Knufia obscura TaxID=1635080 RepID=A0ABR0S1W9_9EURO|nr:hypothetical protein PMZ80_000651 [Knufia obscura]
MSERNVKREAEGGLSDTTSDVDTKEQEKQKILTQARRAAANIDARQGPIDPANRRFYVEGNLDGQGLPTLRERTETGLKRHPLVLQSQADQASVTTGKLRNQSPRQPPTGATSNDLRLTTYDGTVVGHLKLAITATEFQRLLTENSNVNDTLALQIESNSIVEKAVREPAAEPPVGAPRSNMPQPDRVTTGNTPQATPTPAPRKKPQLKQKKPPKEKDWTKAVEKPTGSTKAEGAFCLTCINGNRSCKGTELVWIHGEYRCAMCAEKRAGTGSRRCLWADPVNNITTYAHAKAAAGRPDINTSAHIAERKAAKARKSDGAYKVEDEAEETEIDEEISEDEDSDFDLESAVDAAWQELRKNFTVFQEHDKLERVLLLENMQELLEDIIERDGAVGIPDWQWRPDVASALRARIDAQFGAAKVAFDESMGLFNGKNIVRKVPTEQQKLEAASSNTDRDDPNTQNNEVSDEDELMSDAATSKEALKAEKATARTMSEEYDAEMEDN